MDPETLKKYLKRSAIAGAVLWTVVYVLLAVNLLTIGLGLWPVVVIPLVTYAWLSHLAKVLETYVGFVKPKAKQSQVVQNISVSSELTEAQIANAAARAVQDLRREFKPRDGQPAP